MKNLHQNIFFLLILIVFLNTSNVFAQEKDSISGTRMNPWKTLYNANGFNVAFIFYSNADSYHDGIVVKVHNKNNGSIKYSFELIFRSDSLDKKTTVEGILKPGEIKTGSNSKLFWVPFKDGKTISEVGIKGCRIEFIRGKP